MSPAAKTATVKIPAQPAADPAGDGSAAVDVAGSVVKWLGICLGTVLAVLDEWHGVRLRIPGMPHWLGDVAGFAVVWLFVVAAAWWAAHMVRRHHRDMARGAVRHGKRGAIGAAGFAGRGARAAHGWAGPRWQDRRRGSGAEAGQAVAQQENARRQRTPTDDVVYERDLMSGDEAAGSPPAPAAGPPAPPPARAQSGSDGMSDGMSERIVRAVWEAWCGGEKPRSVTAVRQGPGKYLVHLPLGILTVGAASADEYRGAAAVLSRALGIPARIAHACYVDQRGVVIGPSPYADGVNVGLQLRPDPEAAPPGPAPTEKNGDQEPMTTPNGTVPPRMRLPDEVKDGAPAEWTALADAVGEAEPATDEEYLDLLAGQIAGMGIYGEAIADLYETCVDSIRLDPVAMASLHDVADAAGDFVTAVAYARQKFAGHYQEVREFTGDGGVLPKDGDWITGEGDA